MKKMKLQMLGLSVNDLLSREQMKKVMGGSGANGCISDSDCENGEHCVKPEHYLVARKYQSVQRVHQILIVKMVKHA